MPSSKPTHGKCECGETIAYTTRRTPARCRKCHRDHSWPTPEDTQGQRSGEDRLRALGLDTHWLPRVAGDYGGPQDWFWAPARADGDAALWDTEQEAREDALATIDRIRAEARAEWEAAAYKNGKAWAYEDITRHVEHPDWACSWTEPKQAAASAIQAAIDRARAEGRQEAIKSIYAEFSTLAGDMVTDTGDAEPVDSFTRERALDIIFRAGRPTTEGGSDE